MSGQLGEVDHKRAQHWGGAVPRGRLQLLGEVLVSGPVPVAQQPGAPGRQLAGAAHALGQGDRKTVAGQLQVVGPSVVRKRRDDPRSVPGDDRRPQLASDVDGGHRPGLAPSAGSCHCRRRARLRPSAPGSVVFNILVSNTDDHARNHAAFWDGMTLSVTPAYDISPQLRTGETAAQAMAIGRDGARASKLAVAARAAQDVFAIGREEAHRIVERQVDTIRNEWPDAADECQLTRAERQLMWQRLILNPGVFRDQEPGFDTYGS